MKNAANYSREELIALLPEKAFVVATEILYQISQVTEDKQMYDAREKATLDYESDLAFARMEGIALGEERGEKRGEERGEKRGEERLRRERISLIKNLRWANKSKQLTDDELERLSLEQLGEIINQLTEMLNKSP